jgi:hypothetical protein
MLPGDIAHMVGRSAGLSVTATEVQRAERYVLHAEMFGKRTKGRKRRSCFEIGHKHEEEEEEDEEAAAPKATATGGFGFGSKGTGVSERPPWADDAELGDAIAATASVTSTAMVIALMWVRMLLPREELAARQAAAAMHFNKHRTVAGNFDDLVASFKDLLSGGNLHTRTGWMDKVRYAAAALSVALSEPVLCALCRQQQRALVLTRWAWPALHHQARLWRMLLLQNSAGYWDATPGLALALRSTAFRPGAAKGRPVLWEVPIRWMNRKKLEWDYSDDDECEGVDGTGLPDEKVTRRASVALQSRPSVAVAKNERSVTQADERWVTTVTTTLTTTTTTIKAGPGVIRDDPLHFTIDAVPACMPRALRGMTAANPVRVWTTLLCMALGDKLECHWIANGLPSKEMLEEEVTITDLAETWLESIAAVDPVMAAALPRAREKADRMLREWDLTQEERVAEARSVQQTDEYHVSQQMQRLAGDVLQSLQTKHETCVATRHSASACLCAPGLRR